MCQPGKPTPQGEPHSIWRLAPGGENFHRAKSVALRFSGVHLDPGALLKRIEVLARELGVSREFGGVEIDAVAGLIGEPLLL